MGIQHFEHHEKSGTVNVPQNSLVIIMTCDKAQKLSGIRKTGAQKGTAWEKMVIAEIGSNFGKEQVPNNPKLAVRLEVVYKPEGKQTSNSVTKGETVSVLL